MLSVKAEMEDADQLVGSQITRLSSWKIILNEVLSFDFDLSSSTRNVLRGWIARDDMNAVWMTPSNASCRATCHQANVAGFFAELHDSSVFRALCQRLVLQQVSKGICAFYSVLNVPVHLTF